MPRRFHSERDAHGTLTVSTLVEPFDPDDEVDCSPVIFAHTPAAGAYSIVQANGADDPPDVVLLTREMVQQLVDIFLADELSASNGLRHVH